MSCIRKDPKACDRRQITLFYRGYTNLDFIMLEKFVDRDPKDLRNEKDYIRAIKREKSEKVTLNDKNKLN